MGLFDWLRGKRSPSKGAALPHNEYAATERRLLLNDAANIRKSRNSLDAQVAVTMGLAATISALRQYFGYESVEADCPAEQIISAYAGQGDMRRANRMLDELVHDIKALKGDDNQTWLRMAVMLNPKAIRIGTHAVCSLTCLNNKRGAPPPLPAEMQEAVATTIRACSLQIEQCFGQGAGMPYVSERLDDIVATYALGFLQGLFLSNHADILWAKGNRDLADYGWFVCASGMIPALLLNPSLPDSEVGRQIERASSCQSRLPQLQGRDAPPEWRRIEEFGGADALELVRGASSTECKRLLSVLNASLTPEQKSDDRKKPPAQGHITATPPAPGDKHKTELRREAVELVEKLKSAEQARKDAAKKQVRAELGAYPNSPLTSANDRHLGLLCEYALLKVLSHPQSKSVIWRVDLTYRECLRRKRSDLWHEAKGRIRSQFRKLPTWIEEREEMLENELHASAARSDRDSGS